MSEVNGAFYQSKVDTFHGFIKITIYSIIGIAVFLAVLAAVVT